MQHSHSEPDLDPNAEVIPEPMDPGDRRPLPRVTTGVQQLRRNEDIGDAEVFAADRWYRDYALGVQGARRQ